MTTKLYLKEISRLINSGAFNESDDSLLVLKVLEHLLNKLDREEDNKD